MVVTAKEARERTVTVFALGGDGLVTVVAIRVVRPTGNKVG